MLRSRSVFVFFLIVTLSCSVKAEENPASLFLDLLHKYAQSSVKTVKIDSGLDDGIEFSIFEIDKAISDDVFCQISLMASLGQTQYLCYRKQGETDWYIKRKVLFYSAPYEVNGAETEMFFFRYSNGQTRAYNEKTKHYDLTNDTNDYVSIVDMPSIRAVIELVEKNVQM